ncbi:hypothetical protein BDZ89DRAFT_1034139 [Hymenopellis radicata]|nr:hypothetical protein BDZ89DRAFT_1048531 [Hymenopellis radicata]KAF9044524.1 hypothetical protein BDZ89DRAFT_1034139 [Hymenopellis radicata]
MAVRRSRRHVRRRKSCTGFQVNMGNFWWCEAYESVKQRRPQESELYKAASRVVMGKGCIPSLDVHLAVGFILLWRRIRQTPPKVPWNVEDDKPTGPRPTGHPREGDNYGDTKFLIPRGSVKIRTVGVRRVGCGVKIVGTCPNTVDPRSIGAGVKIRRASVRRANPNGTRSGRCLMIMSESRLTSDVDVQITMVAAQRLMANKYEYNDFQSISAASIAGIIGRVTSSCKIISQNVPMTIHMCPVQRRAKSTIPLAAPN